MITKLEHMFDVLRNEKKKVLVAACANDSHTIGAVHQSTELGLIEGVLVGDEKKIQSICRQEKIDISKFRIVHEEDDVKAVARAVSLINDGEGDLLMKGLVNTDKYMRGILNKENGLMEKKAVLSHVTVLENPNYHKLMIVGDVAIIPLPDLEQKVAIVNYLIKTAHALGIEKPKVALLAASETVTPKIPANAEAAIITKMAERGQISGAFVDGPLAMDLCIDPESVELKGIESHVAGDADCILFPNIESGNVFYKTNTKLANANLGAVVVGARVPAILSSRGDSIEVKMASIALAAMMARGMA
ncbi:MAG TPA: bifunctional enoyl-CoA hydratase/phosphate acetyltransferase [Firmicutes bacterium]|nr:bifunctional enoyl-CoA hydratase/phosphate acetyltransferase [Bacillota bacterium]